MSSLTWYELLGVDRDATPAEIKAAWRDATDKFEPGSGNRQFALFNEAADVLLDPDKRAAYDAELDGGAEPEAEEAEEAEAVEAEAEEAEAEAQDEPEGEAEAPEPEPTEPEPEPGRFGRLYATLISTYGLAAIAVLAVGSVVLAAVLFFRADLGEDADVARARVSAQSFAQKGLAVALSYDYRRLAQDRDAAMSYMTPEFGEKFRKPFDEITTGNVTSPSTAVAQKTVVVGTVQATGVIAADPDRVRLLVYVDQNVTNIKVNGVTYENRVVVTMKRSGSRWLIEALQFLGSDCPTCLPAASSPGSSSTPSSTQAP